MDLLKTCAFLTIALTIECVVDTDQPFAAATVNHTAAANKEASMP